MKPLDDFPNARIGIAGRRFLLRTKILGMTSTVGRRSARYIPKGKIVTVQPGPPGLLINVLWGDREFSIFLADLHERAEDVTGIASPSKKILLP